MEGQPPEFVLGVAKAAVRTYPGTRIVACPGGALADLDGREIGITCISITKTEWWPHKPSMRT